MIGLFAFFKYLWLRRTNFAHGNKEKNDIFCIFIRLILPLHSADGSFVRKFLIIFGFFLAYSYLCTPKAKL